MLEGYITQNKKTVEKNGKEYEVVTYQGDHSEEYLIRAVESGECRLYKKGFLELSWRDEKGQKVGICAVFKDGKGLRRENWSSLLSFDNHHAVENWSGKVVMTIRRGEKNHVVYRGGYDNEESMKREGEGYEYDEESGRVLIHGVWKNDELFIIFQEFESGDEMIEYEALSDRENVSALNRRPMYKGGYVYDELNDRYLRHGKGYSICINTGLVRMEGEWSHGELKKTVKLYGGWYETGKEEGSLRFVTTTEMAAVVQSTDELLTMGPFMSEIVISPDSCNEANVTRLDLGSLKYLKRITIGNNCFMFVSQLLIMDMKEMESVEIGRECFLSEYAYGADMYKHCRFKMMNCPMLRSLEIGDQSFRHYSECTIEHVDALETLRIGSIEEYGSNFCYAPLILKG